MLLSIFYIVAGLFLLVKGGDYLVDGSVAIAKRAKLSPMVIGLTVMGFGTSVPELIVSTKAAMIGSSGIAIGNVVGSNIGNIALILGLTAVINPLPVKRSTLFAEMPFMLLACVLLVGFGMFGSGTIERWQGILFILMITGVTTWQVIESRKVTKQGGAVDDLTGVMPVWKALLIVAVSIAAMMWGANLLIDGASDIAMRLGQYFGVSREDMERIIGLTIVAIGTSFPELFASAIAAHKGETDMAIGNIIGSVTFNILCVIGVAATICPIANCGVGFTFDYLLMLALGLVLWVFLRTKYLLERWEGTILLCVYIAFIVKTVMNL